MAGIQRLFHDIQKTGIQEFVRLFTKRNRTPLLAAATQGNSDAVQLLLVGGAHVDLNDDAEHGNALCCAAKAGKLDIVRLLLNHGSDVNSRRGICASPLGFAIHHQHRDVADCLLRKGACVDLEICQHGRPLDCASSFGDVALVRILLQNGAKDSNRGALEIAASMGHLELFEILADELHERAVGPNLPHRLLAQPCFWARENPVRILFKRIIDLYLSNDDRYSNLAWAIMGENSTIVRCLLENGAQLKRKHELGKILFTSAGMPLKKVLATTSSAFVITKVSRSAVTLCKIFCGVMENIEGSTEPLEKHKFLLTLDTLRRLVIWTRETLVQMAGDFHVMDSYLPSGRHCSENETHENLTVCFDTLTYLEIKIQFHQSGPAGHARKLRDDQTALIQGLEPFVLKPTKVPRRYGYKSQNE